MSRLILREPPADLHQTPLTVVEVPASSLYRISSHGTGEPYFGTSQANRFDDPSASPAGRFGTCYCGFDLTTAIAETILHDELPAAGRFTVTAHEFSSRFLVRFEAPQERATLRLADLTGVALKRLGGDGSISTVQPYGLPQRWAGAIHAHPEQVDGMLYMSRHVNDRKAAVIFSRARTRMGRALYGPLTAAPGLLHALSELQVELCG